MKRFLLICAAVVLSVVLTACGARVFDNGTTDKTAHITVTSPEKTIIDCDIAFSDGATVIEALTFTAKKSIIEVTVNGATGAEYVTSIDGLSQFDRGAQSGWIFRVNGKMPNVGAGTFKLTDGDLIEWEYVTEYTNE